MIYWLILTSLQTPKITIPCGTYSLPEVATFLSNHELQVGVSSSLKERGLLISLHDRSPQEAFEIICKGMDLRVVKESKGRERFEQDPNVAKREGRWRDGLLNDLTRRWVVQEERFMRLAKLDEDHLRAAKQEMKSMADPLSGDVVTQLMMLSTGGAPAKVASLIADSAAPDLRDVLFTDRLQWDETNADLNPALVQEVQKRLSFGGPLTNPVKLMRKLLRRPGTIALGSDVFATKGGKWTYLPYPNSSLIVNPFNDQDQTRHLFQTLAHPLTNLKIPAIGDDAEAWLQASTELTKEILKETDLGDEVEMPVEDHSFSGLVERWAKTHDREVLMELAPIPESLPNRLPNQSHAVSISSFLGTDSDWGLDSARGVLVVRNRMAFLDHALEPPVGDLASYFRRNPKRNAVSIYALDDIDTRPDLPVIEELLPLLRLRFDRSNTRFEWFNGPVYRGLSDAYLFQGSPLLWPGIPEETRQQIAASPEGKIVVPLRLFESTALEEFMGSMMSRGEGDDRLKELLTQLQNANVVVAWKHRTDGETAILFNPTNFPDELSNYSSVTVFQAKL